MAILHDLRDCVLNSQKALDIVLIDGVAGIGKSRLLEQLRISCSLDRVEFAVCKSSTAPSALQQIASEIRRLVKLHCRTTSPLLEHLENLWINLDHDFGKLDDYIHTRKYPAERLISDLVGVLAVLLRSVPIAFVIEDINFANFATTKFIEQLCLRAAEIPTTLILTSRSLVISSQMQTMLSSVWAGDLRRIRLNRLNSDEAFQICGFMQSDKSTAKTAAQMSGGNPLFLERLALDTFQTSSSR